MAEIGAAQVKALREKTGAGMMDCKQALVETAGDVEAAVDWLRKKGLSAAAKKAGRVAAEGLVGLALGETAGALVEINAETDFVARNEVFQAFVSTIARLVLEHGDDMAALEARPYPGSGRTVAEELQHMVATIGENMALRRAARITVGNGTVSGYIHNAIADGLGKIGVIVGMELADLGADSGKTAALEVFGRQVAMHVAASAPLACTPEDLDPAVVERERAVLAEQAKDSGKPAEVIEKMVEGRLRKFYEEAVLLEQVFVVDGKARVKQAVEAAAKEIGGAISVTAFTRFALGEGIERGESDFAAEVAAQVGSS